MTKRRTAEDKAWIRGFACACAELARSPPGSGAVEGALDDAGLTYAVLRGAGTQPYDLTALRRALRYNAERNKRLRSRRSTTGEGTP